MCEKPAFSRPSNCIRYSATRNFWKNFTEERRANPIECETDSDNTSRQFGRWKQVLAMLMLSPPQRLT
jgi:hypothetical protein